jgi:hypothetical protein
MARPNAKAPLGEGGRFAALKQKLARRGAKNPAALAAHIGRKKYGKKRFAQLSAAGRRSARGSGVFSAQDIGRGYRVVE